MDLMAIGNFWLTMLGWLAGLTVGFGILTRLMPCNPGMHWWKSLRAAGADLIYWLIVPLFVRYGRIFLLALGIEMLCGGGKPDLLPARQWPLWVQWAAILLIQDVLLYWSHRAFHTRAAWKFHAIHHSPEVVDWMSTARFHPVNHLFAFALADVVVLLLGFPAEVVFGLAPFNIIYSSMVHANLNWTFGPFKYVLASPVFHRWHHTSPAEGGDKNFASTFPLLDVLFGTFYMPAGKRPQEFGNGDRDFPQGFWGQFLYPFRKKPTPSAPPRLATVGRRPKKKAA